LADYNNQSLLGLERIPKIHLKGGKEDKRNAAATRAAAIRDRGIKNSHKWRRSIQSIDL
jgi:hypothetical protein